MLGKAADDDDAGSLRRAGGTHRGIRDKLDARHRRANLKLVMLLLCQSVPFPLVDVVCVALSPVGRLENFLYQDESSLSQDLNSGVERDR